MSQINLSTVFVAHQAGSQLHGLTHDSITGAIRAFQASGQRIKRLPAQRITDYNPVQLQSVEQKRLRDLLNEDDRRAFRA